jgi:hypothetical protein
MTVKTLQALVVIGRLPVHRAPLAVEKTMAPLLVLPCPITL